MHIFIAAVVFDIFYTWFAIRFISYAHRFHTIEAAMENRLPEAGEQPADNGQTSASGSANFAALEERIEKWIAARGFTEKSVTINTLVPKLYTNRHFGQQFRTVTKLSPSNWRQQAKNQVETQRAASLFPETE